MDIEEFEHHIEDSSIIIGLNGMCGALYQPFSDYILNAFDIKTDSIQI